MQGLRLLISASPDYMIPNHPKREMPRRIKEALGFYDY